MSPIDALKKKYDTHTKHLRAIEDALIAQFGIDERHRDQVNKAVHAAFTVGHGTTTSDDWADSW